MSSLWLKVMVAVPGTKAPQVVALRPTVTLEEAVISIIEKYHLQGCEGKQLSLPPKSRKKGGQVFGKNAVVSHLGLKEKDILELWTDPRMVKVSLFDDKKKKANFLAVDFGVPLCDLLPILQGLFFKKVKCDIVLMCTSAEQKQRFWLSCNQPLRQQAVGHDCELIIFPVPTLLHVGLAYFSPPQKQGYLHLTEVPKLRGSVKKTTSKKYWFILKKPLLIYWSKEKKAGKSAAKDVLCLDRFLIQRVDNIGPVYPYLLYRPTSMLDSSDKTKREEGESYYLSAESNGEMKSWVDVIRPMCINSEPTRVFGVSIKALSSRDKKDPIPPILRSCVHTITERGLDAEGIFRVCGSSNDIEAYKQRYDDGEDVNIDTCPDIHIVCGLLKLWLREMPEPILTFELYDCFVAAQSNLRSFNPDPALAAAKMVELLGGLPRENFEVLKYLLRFLSLVAKNSNKNLMSLENLATVFGPNLLRPRSDDTAEVLRDTAVVSEICETLIAQQEFIIKKVSEYKSKGSRVQALDLKSSLATIETNPGSSPPDSDDSSLSLEKEARKEESSSASVPIASEHEAPKTPLNEAPPDNNMKQPGPVHPPLHIETMTSTNGEKQEDTKKKKRLSLMRKNPKFKKSIEEGLDAISALEAQEESRQLSPRKLEQNGNRQLSPRRQEQNGNRQLSPRRQEQNGHKKEHTK